MTLTELEGLAKLAKVDRGAAVGLALQAPEILELIKRYLELAEFVKGCRFAGDLKSSWISAGAHELLDQFGPAVPLGEKK